MQHRMTSRQYKISHSLTHPAAHAPVPHDITERAPHVPPLDLPRCDLEENGDKDECETYREWCDTGDNEALPQCTPPCELLEELYPDNPKADRQCVERGEGTKR